MCDGRDIAIAPTEFLNGRNTVINKVTKTWSVKLEIAIFSCQIDKCGTWYANALFTKSFTMPNYQTIHILNAKKGSTRKIKHCKDKLVKDGKFRLFGNNVFWECATQRWRDVKVRHEKKYGRKDSISRLTLICKFLTLCETAYLKIFFIWILNCIHTNL
jgi:hypothetical protein